MEVLDDSIRKIDSLEREMGIHAIQKDNGAPGRTKDAAALGEKVLEAQKRILGDEHPNTMRGMNNLALTYRDLGRTKDAAALQEKVLEAQKRGSWGINIRIRWRA
jgi:hypothetical protein